MSTDTTDDQRGRPPYWIAFAAVVFALALTFFLQLIVDAIGAARGASATHPTPVMNDIDNYLFDVSFVLSALYFTTVRGVMGRAEFGYVRIPWRVGIGAVLGAGACYYVVTLVYAAIVSVHGTDRLPTGLGLNHTGTAIAVAVYVCAVAPMAEEFFFRGFLFGILRRMRISVAGREIGPWVAAVIVGILFGLAHFDSAQPEYLVPLGFLGFVLCIMRWKTGSLYPCMALHSINNCIALGVNEFSWNAAEIIAVTAGALAVIALVTGPLSRGVSAPVTDP